MIKDAEREKREIPGMPPAISTYRYRVILQTGNTEMNLFVSEMYYLPHVQAWLSWSARGTVNP